MDKQESILSDDENKEDSPKTCFVITPIGNENSDIRRKADGVIDEIIFPVMQQLGFEEIDVAHRMDSAGSITSQVINKTLDSTLCICNLTALNPNVMYELAIRHACRKPVVCIAEEGTILPFDISEDRIIFYKNDFMGARDLKKELIAKSKAALDDELPDNPIYRAARTEKLINIVKESNDENNDSISVLVDLFSDLEGKVDMIFRKLENKSDVNFSRFSSAQMPFMYTKRKLDRTLENFRTIRVRFSTKTELDWMSVFEDMCVKNEKLEIIKKSKDDYFEYTIRYSDECSKQFAINEVSRFIKDHKLNIPYHID